MLDEFEKLIQNEVNSRIETVKQEFEITKCQLEKAKNENLKLLKEIKELKTIDNQLEAFKEFKKLIDVKNFGSVINFFNLKNNNYSIDGMYYEKIPQWFQWVFHYYEDKEKLFTLMDLFNIEYPSWAKEYKMPYEYNEEELKLFVNPKYDRYICNGCIFSENIGFFWENIYANKGDTFKILTNKQSFSDYIPWQLVLANPLWQKEEIFDLILKALKNKEKDSYYYFAIQKYNNILKELITKMAKFLPKHDLYNVHKEFIEINKDILKEEKWLVKQFKDKICDNEYSTFYYLNFPIDTQKEFIRSYKKSYCDKLDLIKKMNISKEEKIKFVMEFTSQEL